MELTAINNQLLTDLVVDLLAKAKKFGASQTEISASIESGFAVSARMGEPENIEHHREKGFTITVYFDHRLGTVSTSDLNSEALEATLAKACNIAQFTQEDPCAGLADKELLAFNYPDLCLYHPWQISPKQAIDLALECEAEAFKTSKLITNSEGVSVSTYEHFEVYGNSFGFLGHYKTSKHSIGCGLIAFDGHEMQRDYEYTNARDATDLINSASLAQLATQRTTMRLGAKRLSTRQVPVIFAADIARGLLASFINAITGGNLYRKSSFLLNHLHKAVFPNFIQIDERPHLLKGIGSAPFDSEGVATKQRVIVRDGILMSYVMGSYSARKLGMQSTGNADGVHNLFISTHEMNFPQLLKEMGTGLLVTELIGQGVNLVTGDYSRGAFGYWVENGEIQYPIHEITVAGNLKNMFAGIVKIANDVDHRGNIHTGSILIDNMTIAGE